jgi:hypothetical protein
MLGYILQGKASVLDPFVFGPPGTVIIFMDSDPYINKQKSKKI